MDEFIYLKNFNNIKNYLNRRRFKGCESIQLNVLRHTDNDLLYYDNRTLFERFKKTKTTTNSNLKTIIKGNIHKEVSGVHNLISIIIPGVFFLGLIQNKILVENYKQKEKTFVI